MRRMWIELPQEPLVALTHDRAHRMDASKGLTNVALAHEIAVDKDFTLQKIQPANVAA